MAKRKAKLQKKNENQLFLVAIVAIVAVVALVILTLSNGKTTFSAVEAVGGDGNVAGEAFFSTRQTATYSGVLKMLNSCELVYLDDNYYGTDQSEMTCNKKCQLAGFDACIAAEASYELTSPLPPEMNEYDVAFGGIDFRCDTKVGVFNDIGSNPGLENTEEGMRMYSLECLCCSLPNLLFSFFQ